MNLIIKDVPTELPEGTLYQAFGICMKNSLVCLVLALCTLTCSDRVTPWSIKVPQEYSQLTAKNLARLSPGLAPQFPMTVALLADPQGKPGDLSDVVDQVNRRTDVQMVLVLGDLTDYGLLHEYLAAAKSLERLRVPYFTVVGNHDAIAHGKSIYRDMFGDFNYTLEFNGIKFVCFNSNQFEFGESDFGWLKSQVDSQTIVASHVPPVVDMHSQEQIDNWNAIQGDADIIASLHGHRGTKKDFFWETQGVPYYIGPKLNGKRWTLMTINADHSVSFKLCHNECIEEPT